MPGFGRPAEHEEGEARERLLREAEDLFMSMGFAAVSTRQICAAAGVTQPTLYHHFGNKESLYLAVIQTWFARLSKGINKAIAEEPDLPAKLQAIAVLFWSGAIGEYQAMQRDALMHMPPEHRVIIAGTVRSTLIDPVIAVMQAAISAGSLPTYADPIVLTKLFWALVDGISSLYRRGDILPLPSANRPAIDFFLAGARGLTREAYQDWPVHGRGDDLFRALRGRPGSSDLPQ